MCLMKISFGTFLEGQYGTFALQGMFSDMIVKLHKLIKNNYLCILKAMETLEIRCKSSFPSQFREDNLWLFCFISSDGLFLKNIKCSM